MAKRGTGYINADDIIKVNQNFKFLNIYQDTITKKINDTYNIYLNKSIENLPNSILRMTLVASVMNRLAYNNYNDLSKTSNILTQDELVILNGIRTYTTAASSIVLVPQPILDELNAEVAKFLNLEQVLSNPIEREYYFRTYSTDIEYTKGEAEYDSLIISNSDNLAAIYKEIKRISIELDDKINGPVNGINNKIAVAIPSFEGDAIDFRDNYKRLVKYLYYGIKNPDNLSNDGLIYEDILNPLNTDTFVKMKEFFTTKYSTVYLPEFDRFTTVQSGTNRFYQSYRYLITRLVGGTFNGWSPSTRLIDAANDELKSKLTQYNALSQPDPHSNGTFIEKYNIFDYTVPLWLYIDTGGYLAQNFIFQISKLIQFNNVIQYNALNTYRRVGSTYYYQHTDLSEAYSTQFLQPIGYYYAPNDITLVSTNIYGYGNNLTVGGVYTLTLSSIESGLTTNIINDIVLPALNSNISDNSNTLFVKFNLLHKANLLKLLNTDGTSFSANEFSAANFETSDDNVYLRYGILSTYYPFIKLTAREQATMSKMLYLGPTNSLLNLAIRPSLTWVQNTSVVDPEYNLEFT
jgi:hypothetical protein